MKPEQTEWELAEAAVEVLWERQSEVEQKDMV